MSAHHWEQAPAGWGCTASDNECDQPAIAVCRGAKVGCDCDGNEGRCTYHFTRRDFKPVPKDRHCRYCRSLEHFGDRCPRNPSNRRKRGTGTTPRSGT